MMPIEDHPTHSPAAPALTVNVIGTPIPQGSKVANSFGHGVRDANVKKLKPWRAEVAGCIADTMTTTGWTTLDEPVEVTITFFHPRLASHYGTGRNAGVLKATAPQWKSTAPDIDKLARAVLDALTASRAIRDDARVVRLVAEDRYADAATGARITVRPITVAAPVSAPPCGTGAVPTHHPHAEGALF
jgi:Holliday junction resolvase RusA-like endonuclease